MKTPSHLIVLTISVLSHFTFAQQVNQTNFYESQFAVSEGRIQSIIQEMKSTPSKGFLISSDYLKVAENLKRKTDEVLTNFDNDFKSKVIPPIKAYLEKSNAISQSAHISNESKTIMVKQLLGDKIKIEENQNKVFENILTDVVQLFPWIKNNPDINLDISDVIEFTESNFEKSINFKVSFDQKKYEKVTMKIRVTLSRNNNLETCSMEIYYKPNQLTESVSCNPYSRTEDLILGSRNVWYFYSNNIKHYASILINNIYFKNYVYPQIKGDCKSKTCIALISGDYLKLSDLIEKKLNTNIEFLSNPERNQKIKLQSSSKIEALLQNNKFLLNQTDYPEDLPFDDSSN